LVACPVCSKEFRTLYGLKAHFKAAHADALSVCSLCGKRCRNADGLKLHCSWMMRRGCARHGALYYLLSNGAWISRRLGALKGEVLDLLRCGGLDCLRRSCAPTAAAT
jgi:hypothetical protein